jgi:hypothetical protein
LWLEAKGERQEFEQKIFESFDFNGLSDNDIEIKEKQIVREHDRDFENETSKDILTFYQYRIINDCRLHDQLYAGLHEHASLR